MNTNTLKRFNFFMEYINVNKKILEITVGNTHFPRYYGTTKHLVVIDYDKKLLKEAKKYSNKQIYHNLENKLPLKYKRFDVIFIGEILEHLKNTEQLISECKRVLKSDGLLIGSTPNGQNIIRKLEFIFGILPSVTDDHIRFYTKKSLRKQLEKYFTDVEIKYNGFLKGGLLFKCKNKKEKINYLM